jgi:dimethylaniline monooxygenase (N-oxide forming)
MKKTLVAVVGAGKILLHTIDSILNIRIGPTGLSMLKTLRGDGFQVTLFERRKNVGGLWAFSEDPSYTTALPRGQ